MLDKFMRKRKSKHKEEEERIPPDKIIDNTLHECFTLIGEPKRSRLAEIIELLRLEHLDNQEKKSMIDLINKSQDRFHIPGEKLIVTHILQHQISTIDRPINTR